MSDLRQWGIDVVHRDDLTVDTATGDVALLVGPSCLVQDLLNRFETPLGSYELHPEYGCDADVWIQASMDARNLQRIAAAFKDAAEQDPRVEEAAAVATIEGDDELRVSVTVAPIFDDNPLNLVLGFTLSSLTLEVIRYGRA